MGRMAESALNRATAAIGRRAMQRVAEAYARWGFRPLPGRESAAYLDGACQSLFSGFLEDNQTPAGMEGAVDAAAHMVALILYQQTDIERFRADFLRRVDAFGIEFAQDSSKGQG